MFRDTRESTPRKPRGTCELCQLGKDISVDGRLCIWCTRYIAWRKKWMPDGRQIHGVLRDDPAARERRICTYTVRAEFILPLFEDEGKESAA